MRFNIVFHCIPLRYKDVLLVYYSICTLQKTFRLTTLVSCYKVVPPTTSIQAVPMQWLNCTKHVVLLLSLIVEGKPMIYNCFW